MNADKRTETKFTPITDSFRQRIPEPRAVEELLLSHGNLETERAALYEALEALLSDIDQGRMLTSNRTRRARAALESARKGQQP